MLGMRTWSNLTAARITDVDMGAHIALAFLVSRLQFRGRRVTHIQGISPIGRHVVGSDAIDSHDTGME